MELALLESCARWNLTLSRHGAEGAAADGAAHGGDPAAHAARQEAALAEGELATQLHLVLDAAGRLLWAAGGCSGPREQAGLDAEGLGPSNCPAEAPELRLSGVAGFLAAMLRDHPRGPADDEGLLEW